MSKDIKPILEGWPHEPGKVSARKILGADGREKIQLRVDLGLLQMEADGRPDGERPHDCDSLLAYLEQQLDRHRRQHGSEKGFAVDEQDCELLRGEAVQYYYRYLSEFVLEEYEAVARDTERNLRVLDFCNKYAREEADRLAMEQYRPYILMMSARARAYLALREGRMGAARQVVREALTALRQFYIRFGQEELFPASKEVATLEDLLREVEAKIPLDPVAQLRRQLARAVEEERYEEAARLRDELAKAAGAEGRA